MIRIQTQISFFSVPLVVICCMQSLSKAQQCEWDFEPQDHYPGEAAATSGICTADFNGDGWLDVAIANRKTDDVCVFMNDGTGHFPLQPHSCVDIGEDSIPRYVVAGDWDGDGDMDAATANWEAHADNEYEGGSVTVLLNDGTGTLTVASEHLLLRAACLELGDLNGDGYLDIVAAHWDPATTSGGPGFITVLKNNADGTFTEVAQTLVGNLPRGVAIGDLDGDGDLDIAVANLGEEQGGETVTIIENIGDFQFESHDPLVEGSTPRYLAIGDIDGDGLNDIAVIHKGVNTLLIYRNIGDWEFTLSVDDIYSTHLRPHSVCLEDLNGDCLLDVVVSHVLEDKYISVYKNIGQGALELELDIDALHAPAHVIAADVNEDGKPDLLTADVNGGWFSVYISEVIQKKCSFCYGDLTGDGSIDVTDLLFLLADWNQPNSPTFCISDLSDDGIVDVADILIMIGNWGPCTEVNCPADINGDDVVNVTDILAIISAWGETGGVADVNGDGIVDVSDLLIIISAWGAC